MKKIIILIIIIVFAAMPVSAQLGNVKVPKAADVTKQATSAANSLGDKAFQLAYEQFMKLAKDIPFEMGSAELQLDNPSYKVKGVSLDKFMKEVLIPALSKVVNTLPANKKVVVMGHANAYGSEDGSSTFIGNKKLSEQRAQAVLDYLMNQSSLDKSKFRIEALSTSQPREGTEATDVRNCCVSFDIK